MSAICQARPPASRGNTSSPRHNGKVNSKFNPKKAPTSPPRRNTDFIPDANSELQCPHFAECSGCTLETNLASPPILDQATTFFKEILGCENFKLHAGPAQGWRHRARLAVRSSMPDIFGNNKTLVGLFKAGSHITINIPKCTVHHPALNVVADLIRLCIIMCEIDPYDETSGKGQLRYIQLAIADAPKEIEEKNRQQAQQEEQEIHAVQVVLVWNAFDLENSLGLEDFAETLWLQAATKLALAMTTKTAPPVALHSIHANFQPLKNNAILGPNTVLLHGSSESWTHFKLPAIAPSEPPPSTPATTHVGCSSSSSSPAEEDYDNRETRTVPISFDPTSFMQANPTTMTTALQSMRSWIMPGSNIVDLHAGIGTIGLVLAATTENIASLRAVEINPSAEVSFWKSWSRLKKEEEAFGVLTAGASSLSSSTFPLPEKVEYYVAAAGSDPERWLHGADVAILDPPRKGLEPELLDYLCRSIQEGGGGGGAPSSSVKRLLYLSCGFPAFARDCQRLIESGVWKLVSAEAFLFFPGADHIETLAVFDRAE
ncbi:hypothetical protein Ndes2526B_g07059 [Nannochloris sp. 'desiccata']|nr:hypothetical protein KSW81_004878 [Chlorella desiccata (nom. nud.)]KAH7618150.1 putative Uncharacterized RNA methyltransferase pc1998 [Chlorella desiccata (nom. nud.)]